MELVYKDNPDVPKGLKLIVDELLEENITPEEAKEKISEMRKLYTKILDRGKVKKSDKKKIVAVYLK